MCITHGLDVKYIPIYYLNIQYDPFLTNAVPCARPIYLHSLTPRLRFPILPPSPQIQSQRLQQIPRNKRPAQPTPPTNIIPRPNPILIVQTLSRLEVLGEALGGEYLDGFVDAGGGEDGVVGVARHDICDGTVCVEKLHYSGGALVPYRLEAELLGVQMKRTPSSEPDITYSSLSPK
jgi:hypothetical protein